MSSSSGDASSGDISTRSPSSSSVLVLGGGLAGLSCAHWLSQNGMSEVTVLEARDRLGGRMHTMERDGRPLELGAQWIHGGCVANTVFNLAQRKGLLDSPPRLYSGDLDPDKFPGHAFRSDGRVVDEDVVDAANAIYSKILARTQLYYRDCLAECPAENHHKSIAEFFELMAAGKLRQMEMDKSKPFLEDLLCVLTGYRVGMGTYLGTDVEQCSLELSGSSIELPGGDVIVPGGVKTLVDCLSEELPSGAVRLRHVVTRIDWTCGDQNGGKVAVAFKDDRGEDREALADVVVCTLPIGVLKRDYHKLFTPKIPNEKIKAICDMSSGTVSKIFLSWTTPWWIKGDFGVTLAWSPEELENMQLPYEWVRGVFEFTEVEGHSDMLVAWVGGQCARIADQLPDDEVKCALGHLLRQFTGDVSLPLPASILRHGWTSDPLTMGTYSHPTPAMDEEDLGWLVEPLFDSAGMPRVLFAGEAMHVNSWSNMHGARASGLREAQRILQHYDDIS